MNNRQIVLKKVKVHNLKGIDLTLDPYELIVFTGVSGSGKSSLAFDTIFVEGQRRYIESLSHSSKRYLTEKKKPDAQLISGLSPTIAIEQKTISKTPRSTVGTITQIYDYLRVLFAKIATPYCPVSKEIVKPQSKEKIINHIKKIQNKKLIILSPYAKNKKGSFKDDFLELQKKGFTRLRVDKKIIDISESKALDPKKAHDIDIVIDRIQTTKENESRLIEAISLALEQSKGSCVILDVENDEEKYFSEYAYSLKSNLSYPPLTAKDFSFNHPSGMCEKCQGLSEVYEFDIDKIIDPNLSIAQDCCIVAPHYNTVKYSNIYNNLASLYKFNINTPWNKLPTIAKDVFLYGTKKKWILMKFVHPKRKIKWKEYVNWKGVLFEAHNRLIQASSDLYRKKMFSYMTKMLCPSCHGAKIKPYPAAAKLKNKTISEITAFSTSEALSFFEKLKLEKDEGKIAKDLIFEIKKKLQFLINVGLHYLSLDRISPSLSGGESQRVKLASQLGCSLSGATYILDEPSIGLHPQDHHKLLDTLISLKNEKNTIIVVEHDRDTISAADVIVDIGPLAGKKGGKIVALGSVEDIMNSKKSLTGKYLSKEKDIPIIKRKRESQDILSLTKATHNNLKKVDLNIPLNKFICITGVSGSGKSSLISDTLFPALSNKLNRSNLECGKFDKLHGLEHLEKVIFVDQSPIGRTPRSNPATYIKLFDDIRELFASLPLSKAKGFLPGHFSFNVKEGSCSYCKGLGSVKVDMDFMEDVSSTCMQCKGKRFDLEILSILYKNKSIFDVLEMDIEEAKDFFDKIPKIKHKLDLLNKVGLGYLPLGQSATTLSGGEAQRIKLSKELIRPSKGQTLYILDEPTTGLHFHDIEKLLEILQELVDQKNTVIVIEHNMDLVKTADWIIDLGPKASKEGGEIIFEGTVDDIIKTKNFTGIAIKETLSQKKYKSSKKATKTNYPQNIIIQNAHQHNLKNLDLKIPHNKMSCFTGPSGSGKTSLAFDTIFAESQMRYMEALNSYLRQFLKQYPKPKVDKIENLFPAISIEQAHLLNPRSTVGTITEIYDHLRVLYTHLGIAYCPETKERIKTISKQDVVEKVLTYEKNEKIQILTPINLLRNETFEEFIDRLNRQGFLRIRLNNKYYELDEKIPFEKNIKNEIYLVIDRLMVGKKIESRLFEAISMATSISDNLVTIARENEDILFNLSFAVESSAKSYPPITPQSFSFNSEGGMCLTCQGLGYIYGANLFSDDTMRNSTIEDLGFIFFEDGADLLCEYFENLKIDPYTPIKNLKANELKTLLYGNNKPYRKKGINFIFKGINSSLEFLAKHSKRHIKEHLIDIMEKRICPSCNGKRLNLLAQNVKIKNVSITDLCSYPIDKAYQFINAIKLPKDNVLSDALMQIKNHLSFLLEIGLNYISLDRSAPTLSSGEMQRIRLSKQLGSYLTSCIYVLDEPTIGLHPHNGFLLLNALKKLKELGNTLILVEHDPMIIKHADLIFDFGPLAGNSGGQIIAKGTFEEIKNNPQSITGNYLSGRKKITRPTKKRDTSKKDLIIKKANLHNLKNINIAFPLNCITCITGVSGSGKSTLINHILKNGIQQGLKNKKDIIKFDYAQISGIQNFYKCLSLNQSPIGQTIRSDVASYSEILPIIRQYFASLQLSKAKGLQPRHFSYNHKSGMCKSCWGMGYKTINLQYLPSVKIKCDACNGHKINPISLEIKFKNKNLGQVLDLTVVEALDFFENIPKIVKKINTLIDVGLDYLKLSQEITTLSGGEAQRLRLSKELSKRATKNTIFLLDEPTTGLHFVDIEKLLKIFHKLADKNNTLIIIEHNLDVISHADYIIDLGPEAGVNGGKIIVEGNLDKIMKNKVSFTAKYLQEYL